ncbi:MAG: YihY/virulence factor BrkB family protein [Anaerolineae bacterium]|nr:YihY/virulence factor BrkB family protein [Anaerolineae bacterium]MCB0180262.1 YihY/virulence factor BrkB family protein [Anaerolineae bacterium]MCB0223150.1 YihY/virulence factor BrkB family protein [Anaerolineae bacterium]MCB9109534.1 YihY/virulence factor BrkB family protein [Anaerolineales bacterium]
MKHLIKNKLLLEIYELIEDTLVGWGDNDGMTHGAALSFYTIFSIVPLLFLSVGIGSLLFNQIDVIGVLLDAVSQFVGEDIARILNLLLVASGLEERGKDFSSAGLIATLFGIGTLLFSASLIFNGLQISLNAMWNIKVRKESIQENYIKSAIVSIYTRGLSILAVLSVGLLVLALTLLHALWTALPAPLIKSWVADSYLVLQVFNLVISPLVYTMIFASIFKFLPQARIRWRDVWPGALVTALLIWIGGTIVWFSVSRGAISALYGAVSVLISLVIWIFYSSNAFLVGAKFTQVFADRYGEGVVQAQPSVLDLNIYPRKQSNDDNHSVVNH